MLILLYLLPFIGILYGLFHWQQRESSLSKVVFAGLFAGLVYGLLLSFSSLAKEVLLWVNIVGNGYVQLLKMIALPLVFVSILAAVAKVERASAIGKISFFVIATLLLTTAAAAFIGIVIANLFDLNAASLVAGEAEKARGASMLANQDKAAALTIPALLQSFIPSNIVASLAGLGDTAMISTVIIASLLGIAALQVARKDALQGERIALCVETLQVWVLALVRMIIRLTPYGVAALMVKVMVSTNAGALLQLAKFFVASYIALALVLLMHAAIIYASGRNVKDYVRKVLPVLTFAFTSRSSAATIALNIETQTQALHIASPIANFAASFGATIGQNGCAGVYPAMLAIMIAPTMGIDPWSVSFIASVIVVVVIASFGVAGVGGGATFAAIIVLSTLGLPIELAGLLISIEPVIDMMRTAVNVNGSMTAGVVTQRLLGKKLSALDSAQG